MYIPCCARDRRTLTRLGVLRKPHLFWRLLRTSVITMIGPREPSPPSQPRPDGGGERCYCVVRVGPVVRALGQSAQGWCIEEGVSIRRVLHYQFERCVAGPRDGVGLDPAVTVDVEPRRWTVVARAALGLWSTSRPRRRRPAARSSSIDPYRRRRVWCRCKNASSGFMSQVCSPRG